MDVVYLNIEFGRELWFLDLIKFVDEWVRIFFFIFGFDFVCENNLRFYIENRNWYVIFYEFDWNVKGKVIMLVIWNKIDKLGSE